MIPCLRYKDGVHLAAPPTPGGIRIQGTLERAARALGFDVLITCGAEDHPVDDPHTKGNAFDVRTADLTPPQVVQLLHWLQVELGDAFYVQYEYPLAPPMRSAVLLAVAVRNASASAEHLHVQVAKGTSYPPV